MVRFALVTDAKSDLEDVYLGPESDGQPREPFWGDGDGEGMAESVSGEADWGFLHAMIDDLGLFSPAHCME